MRNNLSMWDKAYIAIYSPRIDSWIQNMGHTPSRKAACGPGLYV